MTKKEWGGEAGKSLKPSIVRNRKLVHKPCPFCGDTEPIVMQVFGALHHGREILHCQNCEAEAPLKVWDSRRASNLSTKPPVQQETSSRDNAQSRQRHD